MMSGEVDSVTAELLNVKWQERKDHQHADHVDEGRRHERHQLGGDFSHLAPEDVKQSEGDDSDDDANKWRIKRLREVRLQEHGRHNTRVG